MTRKEAIEIINNTSFFAPSMSEVDEALNMAIESLSIDVVRCKDCIHHKKFFGRNEYYCDVFDWHSRRMDYCSFGERREDEQIH